MTEMEITAILRQLHRARVRVINGGRKGETSDSHEQGGPLLKREKNPSLHNRRAKCAKSQGPNISYQTLPSTEEYGQICTPGKTRELSDVIPPGPKVVTGMGIVADEIVPISNLPQRNQISDEIPDEYRFEIFRLRRQITALSNDLRYENARVTKALEAIHDEIRFWELGIFQHQWETLGQIQRRLKHLEAIARALESPGPIGIPQPAVKARKR